MGSCELITDPEIGLFDGEKKTVARKGASPPKSLINNQPTAKGVESLGNWMKRALAACGIVEVPVSVRSELVNDRRSHCALLVTYPSGRMRGWIFNSVKDVREFEEENSECKCLRMERVPTEWYNGVNDSKG